MQRQSEVFPPPGLGEDTQDTQAIFCTIWIRGQVNRRAPIILKTYYHSRSLFTHKYLPCPTCLLFRGLRAYFINVYYPGPLAWGFAPYFRPACTRLKRKCSTTGQIYPRKDGLLSQNRTLRHVHAHLGALGPSWLQCWSVREPPSPR